jgi:hypothetical protein
MLYPALSMGLLRRTLLHGSEQPFQVRAVLPLQQHLRPVLGLVGLLDGVCQLDWVALLLVLAVLHRLEASVDSLRRGVSLVRLRQDLQDAEGHPEGLVSDQFRQLVSDRKLY